ncbi:hypothetical protein [Candidatus Pristimantibacillus sp. PTI5]|uniref:hypothetical protein n=1 Tax=Candidatus Pristimantibacillus sp. PTI5 TaxID=3400422 RepID=UPI003B0148B2
MGQSSSGAQLVVYDKQRAEWNKRKVVTDTWTRAELRLRLERMKRISAMTVDDLSLASKYNIITDVSILPSAYRELIESLNAYRLQWSEITRTTQRKIRDYGENGFNFFEAIPKPLDLSAFLYTPDISQSNIITMT